MLLQSRNSKSGQQLIEIIIASAILLIMAQAFFTLINAAYKQVGLSRIQSTARALGNQHLETIRNLPFSDVGTQGGIPSGTIAQQQTISANGQQFRISTYIIYIDDPFDGSAPTDLLASDYKRVKVTVSWTSTFPTQEIIELITDIAPKGPESDDGGGTLAILVYDSNGQPVPQADVHIEAPGANPPITLDLFTDDYGNLILPGAPICTACYSISVTKSGYSTDKTYTTAEVTNPNQPPVTILENQVSQVSFAIDRTASVTFTSSGPGPTYNSLNNVDFNLQSTKVIGTNAQGEDIYKIDKEYATDSNGNLQLDLEWDAYKLTLDNTVYDIGAVNPTSPFSINPGQTVSVLFIAQPHTPNSLLTIVHNASGSAIASATATLRTTGFQQIATTAGELFPDFGQVFFPSLTTGNYTIEIIHPSYETATESVSISGQNSHTIILNPAQ